LNLIFGIHSIEAAINNPKRGNFKLFCTQEALSTLRKNNKIKKINWDKVEVNVESSHGIQEASKRYFKELELETQRVPSGAFLVCDELEIFDINHLYQNFNSQEKWKILALDQVTDVHNAAAILRTASFYGIDAVIVPSKKSFGLTPSFFRIASGASEFVSIYETSNLSKVVKKLCEMEVFCAGLSEHAATPFNREDAYKAPKGICLVLGKEDVGISNAVMRNLPYQLSLTPMGDTQSLNVSAAAAVAMEKCFGEI
jgi:23S rRNA (guanosine2251-2'-O)-methyltransferase